MSHIAGQQACLCNVPPQDLTPTQRTLAAHVKQALTELQGQATDLQLTGSLHKADACTAEARMTITSPCVAQGRGTVHAA